MLVQDLARNILMELCSNVFFGGVVNDKRQPDMCICLAKLAELSALFLCCSEELHEIFVT